MKDKVEILRKRNHASFFWNWKQIGARADERV